MWNSNGSRSEIRVMTGRAYYHSPVGLLMIESEDQRITVVSFQKEENSEQSMTPIIEQCIAELDEYFFKGRKFFSVDLLLRGTEFQVKVWNELVNIPYGRTNSYLDVALRLGDINLVRAVGIANGENPIAIIVPCHRVIGKNGGLVGYGGGLEKKEWLLQHEGAFSEQLKLF
jgi:methylated-DNA-[protein]-cysteine S-methyltransferase